MLAFHQTTVTKPQIIKQLKAHAKADEFIKEALDRGIIRADIETGNVYSIRWRKGKSPLGCKNQKGYIVFTLHLDGKRIQAKTHRVVWISKYGHIPDGLMPDHKNRIKSDNRIENLNLVDGRGNAKNRRSYNGSANPSAKINAVIAKSIKDFPASLSTTATKFNVSKSLVAQIRRNELWAC